MAQRRQVDQVGKIKKSFKELMVFDMDVGG